MQTVLRSATTEVEISTDDPLIMIGEKVNPTGREKLAEALQQHNIDYGRKLALKQVDNLGVSNVSFGLPDRHTLNQSFLALAVAAGATCAITNPIRLGATLRTIDLLRGCDLYAKSYIKYLRAHPITVKQ